MFTPLAVQTGNTIISTCPPTVPLRITRLCNIVFCPRFTIIRSKRNLCPDWHKDNLDFEDSSSNRTSVKRHRCSTTKHRPKTTRGIHEKHQTIDVRRHLQHITNESGDGEQSRQKHVYLSKLNFDHHPSLCSTLHNSHFTVYYNKSTKTPCWVYEYLTPENFARSTASRKNMKFRENYNLGQGNRATLEDYKLSGFDRGHMAAAGNYRMSQDAMNQTFLLSNILPQVGAGFNQSIWKHLEEGIRDIVCQSICVHLYTGPLFIPQRNEDGIEIVKYQVIGQNRVAVPTHLFKTMLIVSQSCRPFNEFFSMSVIMPNQNICNSSNVEDFLVSLEDVASLSGLQFFIFLKENKIKYQEILGRSSDKNCFIDIFRALRYSFNKL